MRHVTRLSALALVCLTLPACERTTPQPPPSSPASPPAAAPAPASTSEIEIALPPVNTKVVSSFTVCAPGTVLNGAC